MSLASRAFGPLGLFAAHPVRPLDIDGASFGLPLHVYACDMHILSGTVALEPLARLLEPEGLRPAALARPGGPPVGVAQVWLNDYGATSIGPYRELMISFSVAMGPAAAPHRDRNFLSPLGPFADPRCAVLVRWLYLDQPLAIDVGRRVWGFPKEPGRLVFAAGPGGRLRHETRDRDDRLVVRADFAREAGPTATLRTLAAMLPGLGPAITVRLLGQRTHAALAITPRALKQTRAPIRFQGWADCFPWRGALELGDVPGPLALRDLGFAPRVVQRMPAVRFVMLAPE